MSVFIAMCQVNIALGILYLGLPESRYREKLTDTILSRLSDSGCDDMNVESNRYRDLMKLDGTFAVNHHYILGWVGEVPPDKLKDKWKELLGPKKENRTSITADLRYSWFKYRLDQWWSLVVLVILPILAVWMAEFRHEIVGASATISCIVLGLGQLSVAVHVIIGRGIASWIGRQIVKRSEYMSSKLHKSSAESQKEDVDQSLSAT